MYNTYNTSKYTIISAVRLGLPPIGLAICVPQLLRCFYAFRFYRSCCMKFQMRRIFIAFLFRFFGYSPCFPLTNSEFMTLILWYSKTRINKATHVSTVFVTQLVAVYKFSSLRLARESSHKWWHRPRSFPHNKFSTFCEKTCLHSAKVCNATSDGTWRLDISKKVFKRVLKSANKIRFIRQIKEMIKHYNIMRRC